MSDEPTDEQIRTMLEMIAEQDRENSLAGWAVRKIAELEARVAELDRLNTDLAMESHALQARVAELEAQQDAINQILDNASDGNCWPDEWPMEVVCIVEAIADAIDDEPTQEDQQ